MRFLLSLILSLAVVSPAAAIVRLDVPDDLSAPYLHAITVGALAPHATATIRTLRHDADRPQTFVATATFAADAEGRIDAGTMAPTDGSYTGVDAQGLFWSGAARAALPGDPAAGSTQVTVTTAGQEPRSALVRNHPDPATIVVTTDTPFPGAVWARPTTPGRHPVIIVLGGSEGGASTARSVAPLFAAHGYATLGLPYYDPGYDPTDRIAGLPATFTEIPVDRLVAVRAWLAAQPVADADRIGLWGASKGAEFALIAASHYDWICAVAAIVPSDLVWEGWGKPGITTSSFAIDGKPLPFEPYAGMDAELAKAAKGEMMDLRRVHDQGRAANPGRIAAARIPIERFHGALLVAGGERDRIWPSAAMARAIAATRRAAGEATTLLTFADAGHALGGPGTTPAALLTGLGGTPDGIAHARSAVWDATFALFDAALRPARR